MADPFLTGALITGGLGVVSSLFGRKRLSGTQRGLMKKAWLAGEPYRKAGRKALSQMEAIQAGTYDVSPSALYRFRLAEARKGLSRRMAAMGLYGSGAAIERDIDLTGRLTGEETERQYGRLERMARMGLGAPTPTGATLRYEPDVATEMGRSLLGMSGYLSSYAGRRRKKRRLPSLRTPEGVEGAMYELYGSRYYPRTSQLSLPLMSAYE
jgi:hypothetical protein